MEKYMETGVIASYLEPQKSKAPGRIVLRFIAAFLRTQSVLWSPKGGRHFEKV